MKKVSAAIFLILVALAPKAGAYIDHRGHNLDSLERVVSVWTPAMIDKASDDRLAGLVGAWEELMLGYSSFNSAKCDFYANKVLDLAVEKGWGDLEYSAYKMIGQTHWAGERYDSAAFCYRKAMEAIDRMAGNSEKPGDASRKRSGIPLRAATRSGRQLHIAVSARYAWSKANCQKRRSISRNQTNISRRTREKTPSDASKPWMLWGGLLNAKGRICSSASCSQLSQSSSWSLSALVRKGCAGRGNRIGKHPNSLKRPLFRCPPSRPRTR